ncbi:PREDICTED: DNA-damage-repair/toleration protein DRT100-like [Camelina sativa]|uniref:DNA-damage-repair/toleration protein DRT100-like n=1 Tax=Camelina sativa TaxID=90675 RepID=A0ABM0Y464_CAMSA|nr:PREDICTED: DNA-damage-repair/toleration protein DRT100-like [Camelina sativa]
MDTNKSLVIILLVVVLLLAATKRTVQSCFPSDRVVLLEFRAKLNEPYIGVFNTWKGQDCCKGRINNTSGVIPRDIGRLKMLSRVLLSGNKISGQIPESLTRIYRLADLEISMNRLTGSIPVSFGKMSVLATLNLDGNLISGDSDDVVDLEFESERESHNRTYTEHVRTEVVLHDHGGVVYWPP